MDRPSSAASLQNKSAAMSSTTSTTTTHKRTASKITAAVDTHNPAVIPLFVRNCRLLNLDLLPDWPSVTPASLGLQDARTRIRCAEWCLYQLFRVYDQPTTQEKLQPFFPPLEPLQSINLRAALYRCLNELKKDGVLGREAVLRKSMLDDCQGDKFWELCLTFSAIVLRKVVVDDKKHGQRHTHITSAKQIGLAETLSSTQRRSMLPLAIAHRAALKKVLNQKENKRRRCEMLYDVLVEKEVDLRLRKLQAQEQANAKHERTKSTNVAQDVLEMSWVGSDEVRNALENGDEAAGGDSLLIKPFKDIWVASEEGCLPKRDAAETGLLEDLESRTRHQKRRLQKWRTFHEKLLASKPQPTKITDNAAKNQLRFDRHQNMTLRDMSDNSRPSAKHERHASAAKYDEILTAMREELRQRAASNDKSPTKPVDRVRRPAIKHQSISVDTMMRVTSPEPHHRSMSQTAVPLRPMFGKRVSSRSRSYQQPKVVSQREQIPLKSELFSPLKTDRANSASPSPRGSILASPVEESPLESNTPGTSWHTRQDSATNGSYAGLGIEGSQTPSRSTSSTSSPRVSWKSSSDPADSVIDAPQSGGKNYDAKSRASLADRTRMSMAFKSSEDTSPMSPVVESPVNNVSGAGRAESPPVSNGYRPDLQRRPTLEDRTRQSIAAAPQSTSVPLSRKPQHTRSRTSQFPTNQFETPEKQTPRRSTLTLEPDSSVPPPAPSPLAETRKVTPRNKLFEEDVEYSSVFKARPKLARSPSLTPQVDSGHTSLEIEIEVRDLNADSPSAGR